MACGAGGAWATSPDAKLKTKRFKTETLWHTVDGRNPFRTTWKPWLKPLFIDIYVGESSFQIS